MELHQTKKLLHCEETISKTKRQLEMTCANDTSNKGLISKPYQELIQFSIKNQLNWKMGRGPEQAFFHSKHTAGQQAHGKMLNITDQWRNANQNHKGIPPHTCQNALIKRTRNSNWQRSREKESLVHCCW